MALTEREGWLLNLYRNSELHGALLMGRLARTVSDDWLLVEMTGHCATEARHAAMLSRTIAAAGGRLDTSVAPIQEHYAAAGGVPGNLLEILVLSEVLERRVRDSYNHHLAREQPHPAAAETLSAIVAEMEAKHGAEHAGWIDTALSRMNSEQIEEARRKWQRVDQGVAARLRQDVDARFGVSPYGHSS
jgi:hypothetical protein